MIRSNNLIAAFVLGVAGSYLLASCSDGYLRFPDGLYTPVPYASVSPQDTRVLKFPDARIVVSSETEDVVITYETEGYEYRVTYDIVDRYEDERGIPE